MTLNKPGVGTPERICSLLCLPDDYPAFPLLRGCWEARELADVALVMLDDHRGLEIGGDLLEAVQRGQCAGVVGVEHRNAVGVVVLPEVREVAGEQHVTLLLQLH
jgi:hypothetical protein